VICDYVECPTDGFVREPIGFLTNTRRDFFFFERNHIEFRKKKILPFGFWHYVARLPLIRREVIETIQN